MRFLRDLLVMAGSVVVLVAAIAAQTPEADLQRAIQKEITTGDLAAAIADYQRIAQRAGSNPVVAARALLRLAEAHQRRGDAEARRVYEQIVRDYPSQTDVVTIARARLEGAAPRAQSAGTVNRQLWSGPKADIYGTVSPDGRHLSFADWETGELGMRDLVTGQDRLLTNDGPWERAPDFAEESVISPDGTQIAYAWYVDRLERYQLRLGRVDQPATAAPRIVVDDPDVTYIAPFSWSPDGTSVAVAMMRARRVNQVGLVRVRDGAITVLKTIERGGLNKVLLSPDGKFVAYNTTPGQGTLGPHDAYVLNVNGGAETPVAPHRAHDLVVGWSPAGDQLLFASDRSGSMGLWAAPIKDGRPSGTPVLVKSDIRVSGMGVTRTGTLVYGFQSGAIKVYTAGIDFATGRLLSAPKEAGETYLSNHRNPQWSPDGRRLAYTSQGIQGRATSLAIISMADGRGEEIDLQTTMFDKLRWTLGGILLCNCADFEGRGGVHRVDPATGALTPLALGNGQFLSYPTMTRDGQRLLFTRTAGAPPRQSIVVRDVTSGAERELVTDALLPAVSPDGRTVAYLTRKPDNLASARVHVISIEGGTSNIVSDVHGVNPLLEWTPDGRGLVTNKFVGNTTAAVAVPVDGGREVVLALPADRRGGMLAVHPDGGSIAFAAGRTSFEVWALENFLAAAAK